MNFLHRLARQRAHGWLSLALSLILAACGGGGAGDAGQAIPGSGSSPGGNATATAILTGTAATGGPISGIVALKDASAAGRTLIATTASDGSFSFNVTGLSAPFLLKVTYGDASAPAALYSIATAAGNANITPLTSIAARTAIEGADLESFFRSSTSADIAAAGSRMQQSVAALQNAMSALLQRFDVQGNLLSTPFTADHAGVDAMMDAITVDFRGATITVTAKSSGLTLFSAPPANLGAGHFNVANLEQTGATAPMPGGSLYTLFCAGCHGALSDSTKRGITVARLQAAINNNSGGMRSLSPLTLADMQSIVAALGSATPTTPTITTPPTVTPPTTVPMPPDGGALYASGCARCHGALASSSKLGATSVRIQNAISAGTGGMGVLSSLTGADIQAIAVALASVDVAFPTTPDPTPNPTPTPTPNPTPTPQDGAALYASSCARCHGPLGSSSKQGVSIARLQAAITNDTGGMGALSALSVTDVQAIVTALTPGTPTPTPTTPPAPLDGAALYAASCAGCHGPLASSAKAGATALRIRNGISSSTTGMAFLSILSATEIQAIATALAPGTATPTPTPTRPSPPDGAALYASSCAACHGPLASSAKAGATAIRIQNGISSRDSGMAFLSILSASEVQAIATALASVAPAPPPPASAQDGPTLYAQYCASCHGALANSTKGRASASSIRAAIAADTGGMGSLSALQSGQISAIASALALTSPQTGACGSCHSIPPALGEHGEHSRFTCATCHGVGYGTNAVNPATHNNGVVDLVSSTGWVAATGSCSNSCHGRERWLGGDRD